MRLRSIVVFALALLAAVPALAQSFRTSPTSAILYKNGLSWIVEEGRGETETNWAVTVLRAIPLAGTLLVEEKGGNAVKEVRGTPRLAPSDVTTIGSVMEQRSDKRIWVTSGGVRQEGQFAGVTQLRHNGELMLSLDVKGQTLHFPASKIERLESAASPREGQEEPRPNEVHIRLDKGAQGFMFALSYMTRGLGWTPTYLLDFESDSEARLRMNAVVVNSAGDMASVKMQFATGEGAFPFRHLASPLFDTGVQTEGLMQSVMGQASMGDQDQDPFSYGMGNMIPAQQMQRVSPRSSGEGLKSSEETHLYGPVELSLEKGDRALVPLGSGKVPAELIYYWKAPHQIAGAPAVNQARLAALLTNKLDFPLTTGPILITRRGTPLGQGVVQYTHKGGEALIPIALASTVLCSAQEVELERSRTPVKISGDRWFKVSIKGTLTIRNNRGKTVKVRVEKPLDGRVTQASHKGQTDERIVSPHNPNPSSTVNWDVSLKKDSETKLTYTYDALVRDY